MSTAQKENTFGTLSTLTVGGERYHYYALGALSRQGAAAPDRWPRSVKVLLEALLRRENGREVRREDVEALCGYDPASPEPKELPFMPARVVLQDFTGVPSIVDLAALRSAMARLGGDPSRVNPQVPVDLVIDHSIQVDAFGSPEALGENIAREFERNQERYAFLRWGQRAFDNFRVFPPGAGIVHQVNLEYLASGVQSRQRDGRCEIFPDSLVGTDSHTTMINGLGILGWGVGGIEAEAVMLGQPISMLAPHVVGFRLQGELPEGVTATDLVLTVTQLLRAHGVVGKFVEFFGPGLDHLTLPDRATIANMAPEYGATVGFFPLDDEALRYLRGTGRDAALVALVEAYAREQGLFRSSDAPEPIFAETLELDLSSVVPSVAGPKRPQDRIALDRLKPSWERLLRQPRAEGGYGLDEKASGNCRPVSMPGNPDPLQHGSVVIAAITSCTNTSNPAVLIAAGLVARKAVRAGLKVSPTVKTSLAPGSRVVTDYLTKTGLLGDLEKLGFHVVGYGCTTCIGNSGPLADSVIEAIGTDDPLIVASVLSGNRNFEGRINPHTRANFLASPPLVVAFALAGTVDIDLTREPLSEGPGGKKVYLKDLWPSPAEIAACMEATRDPAVFRTKYGDIDQVNEAWNRISTPEGALYPWQGESTYIQEPPFFQELTREPKPVESIHGGRVLVQVGDSVTTDHISPAGAIAQESPAGQYLRSKGIAPRDFNSYGSRRGNDRVMTRGTFANVRLRNQLAPETEGGWTRHFPSGDVVSIYEAAQRYAEKETPTLVLAGSDYGMGSSRDWAAKGTYLLGVRAVVARSFERIHRSNLIGMGILPLQFAEGESAASLGLTGEERFDLELGDDLQPGASLKLEVTAGDGTTRAIPVTCRIDTPIELDYYRHGGILHMVLRRLLRAEYRGGQMG